VTKVVETVLEKDTFQFLTSYCSLFASHVISHTPSPTIQCCIGVVVCAVLEIENSTLLGGEEVKSFQDTWKLNFVAKWCNTFVAHCSIPSWWCTCIFSSPVSLTMCQSCNKKLCVLIFSSLISSTLNCQIALHWSIYQASQFLTGFLKCLIFSYFFLERKLESKEFPHNVYIRTYSALSTTSLALRKWIFTLARVCTRFCFSADLCLFDFN